ncbi:MAG: DPP IV N-terminal domain-containing protein, partial [Ferruginibacter sp.]
MRYPFKFVLIVFCLLWQGIFAQNRSINWTADGTGYYSFKEGSILRNDPKTESQTVVITKEQLTVPGSSAALKVQSFDYSPDRNKILLFANTAKVWRYNTRGDYWVLNSTGTQLKQLGKGLAAQSLMFAKFSPDSRFVAYVSEHNLF